MVKYEGDLGSISGLGRSPGGGSDNPLQYSCLENSMDRGAWRDTVHRVTKRHNSATESTGTMFVLTEITESDVANFTSTQRRFVSKNKIHNVTAFKV